MKKKSYPKIKVASSQDLPEIYQLAETIWTIHYTQIISKEQIDYMLEKFCSVEAMQKQIDQENYQFYLVSDQNKSIGYFAIKPEKEKLFISKIYLLPECQGKGIGQILLNYISEIAESFSCSKLYLTVNKQNANAIKAYKKNGFEIVDSVVTDIGKGYVMDDYIFEKKLHDLN